MPTPGKGVESGAVRSLLDLFRFGKKKKEKARKEPARALDAPAIAEPLPKQRAEQAPAATPAQDVPAAVIPIQPEPASKAPEPAPCAPALPKRDVQLDSQPVDGNQAAMQHDKLLAALESTQNTVDPLINSARMSFNVDLSGVLFVQRTNTQSGTDMVMPPRVAEGGHVASGLNSGEGTPLQRIHEDASPGPYSVPQQCNSTATAAALHSAAINTAATNQDSSNALYSMANNLQDMLYADYDTLERFQTRPERGSAGGSGAGGGGVASGGHRREPRPPAVPSLLRPPQASSPAGARTEPQMELGAPQKGAADDLHGAATAAAAAPPPVVNAQAPEAAGSTAALRAAAGGSTNSMFRSAPLVQVQQPQPPQGPAAAAGPVPTADGGAQQHGHQAVAAAATRDLGPPDRNLGDGGPLPQTSLAAPRQYVQVGLAAAGQQSGPRPPAPTVVQPEEAGGSAAAAAAVAAATAGSSALQSGSPGGTLAAPAKAGTGAGAIRSGGGASDTHKSLSQEINLKRVPAPKPAAPAAAPAAAAPAAPAPAAAAAAIRAPGAPATSLAHDLASLVAGPALPSYLQKPNPQPDPPAPLSRPMKLTTACLSAYTTLYDNGGDQNFQRALQRKMQLVYKWLQASDLTAPPDNRLEVPVEQLEADDVSSGYGGGGGGGGGEGASLINGDGAQHGTAGREGAAAPSSSRAVAAVPAVTPLLTRGSHQSEHAAAAAAAAAASLAAAGAPHSLGAVGAGQAHPGRATTSGDRQAVSGSAAPGAGATVAQTQAQAQGAPSASWAHPIGAGPGHGEVAARGVPPRGADAVAAANGADGMAAGAAAAATSAVGPGVPNDRSPPAQSSQHRTHQLQPQQQQQQHLSAQPGQCSGAPGYPERPAAAAAHPATGAHVADEPPAQPPRPQASGAVRPPAAHSADPTAAAAASQQLQLPLQHSLSDLYGNSQALPGVHLPPRVLAGSEADLGSASVGMAAAAAGAAAAGADVQVAAAAAAAAADRPSASRLHGRATSSAPTPGPDGSLPLHSAAGMMPTQPPPPTQHPQQHPHPHPQGLGAAPGTPSAPSSTSGTATQAGAGRTKSIAVASHCPPELQPQPPSAPWTIDDFSLLKKLYEGSLSVVCQAQHKRSGRHVALKIYKRSRLHEMERFQLAREICLHIRIVHPHVVALYAAWKDSKYVYLALDWAPLGNMFDFLVARGGRLGEEEAARVVMMPLMSALAFLHSQHFIHRDVKLENLLLDASNCLKLADFGLAIDQKFEQANTRLGTFGYFAPEVLDCPLKKGPFDMKDTSVPGYDSRVDVWSAGVVGYEVLTGRAPFSASSPSKIIQAIRTRELDFPGISEEGRDFLRSALTRDPALRPTAKQLLGHPWILRHCGGGGGPAALPSRPLPSPPPAPVSAPEALPLVPPPPPPMQLASASATVASGPTERLAATEMVPQVMTLIADGALSAPATLAELGGGRLAGLGEVNTAAAEAEGGRGGSQSPGVP